MAHGEASSLSESDPGMAPRQPWSSQASNLNIGTLVATPPDAWRSSVSGRPGVNILVGLASIYW